MDTPCFQASHEQLLAQNPEDWSIVRKILLLLDQVGAEVSMHDLSVLARDNIEIPELRHGAPEQCQPIVQNALCILRDQARELFVQRDCGWLVPVASDGIVRWKLEKLADNRWIQSPPAQKPAATQHFEAGAGI